MEFSGAMYCILDNFSSLESMVYGFICHNTQKKYALGLWHLDSKKIGHCDQSFNYSIIIQNINNAIPAWCKGPWVFCCWLQRCIYICDCYSMAWNRQKKERKKLKCNKRIILDHLYIGDDIFFSCLAMCINFSFLEVLLYLS